MSNSKLLDKISKISIQESKYQELSLDERRQLSFFILIVASVILLLGFITMVNLSKASATTAHIFFYLSGILILIISLFWFKRTNNIKSSGLIAISAGIGQLIVPPILYTTGEYLKGHSSTTLRSL